MSFYDDASLVFLPSGGAGKDTKAYSIKPTNGDGDFTFSRGSNLTATRIDSNGLIEKGRENLFLNSNTPATQSITITNGGVYVLSFLGSGSVVASGGASFTLNGTGEFDRVENYFVSSSTSVTLTISGTITEPQLELGLAATEYIESGATKGKAGILEDSPRFDYSGGASCPSLLVEQSRSNIVGFTEYLEGTNWGVGGSTGLELRTSITSPDGNNGVYLVTSEAGNISSRVQYNLGTLGNDHIFSVFIKGTGSATRIRLRNNAGSQNRVEYDIDSSGNFTLNNETALDDYYGVDDYGNGWHRVYLKVETSSGSSNFMQIFSDVVDADGSIYVWGAQAEDASYISSYIPNHSGGSVTRDADITSVTSVSDLIGQTEGTIYCEFEYNGAADTGVFNRIIGLGTGVTQNRILLAKNNTTAELLAFAVTGGTTQVSQAISGTSIIGHHKVAISYKANEYKVYLDGELEFTDTSASVPATTDVYIGTAEDGTTDNELGGVVKQSIIFKEVLSEDDCKALTTI